VTYRVRYGEDTSEYIKYPILELWRNIINFTAAHKLRWSIISSYLSTQFKIMIFHIFTSVFTIMGVSTSSQLA